MSHRVRAAPGANKVKSVFCGGVYVAKYTLRAARKNARFGANPPLPKKAVGLFGQSYDRCALKFPPVRTPSCTMKNAAGSILLTSCCSVSSSYFDTQMHSTCTGSPV